MDPESDVTSLFPPMGPPVEFDGTAARQAASQAEPSADPDERRRSERRPESATAWLSNPMGEATTNGRTVAVNDLSLHGIGFISHKPCQVGGRHWLLVTRGPMRLSTRVRIAACRPRPDGRGWDIGGEFF